MSRRNSKIQISNSNQTPNSKLQIPNSHSSSLKFGTLEFLWILDFGIWKLSTHETPALHPVCLRHRADDRRAQAAAQDGHAIQARHQQHLFAVSWSGSLE
jgi:hypothetical protein